jgi:hypothetical protein
MDGINKAKQERIITRQQVGLLTRYINCDVKRLKGAGLLALNRLDDKTKLAAIAQRELNKRSMGIVTSGNAKIEVLQGTDNELGDIFEKNKSSGRVDGYRIGRLKKLLDGTIKNPSGIPLRDFNKLDDESKAVCFKLCPDFRKRVLEATGIGKDATDNELIDTLRIRERSEGQAKGTVIGLRKRKLMFSAFNKLDNETQALLMSDCDPIDKHAIITDKIKSGAVSKREGKYLHEFVNTNEVCKAKKEGIISGQEAGCLKKITQGFVREVKEGSITAKALAKLSERTRAAFMLNYEVDYKVKERSAKTNAAKNLSVAGTHVETNAKIIQKATEFSLEINQLEQIREGTPVHIRVQDKHGEYFVRVH